MSLTLFGDNTVTATKTKKNRMLRARIGDLAIARFDDCSVVCLVLECDSSLGSRDYRLVHWHRVGDRTVVDYSWLPSSCLTRAMPKMLWDGKLSELTLDLVEPVCE